MEHNHMNIEDIQISNEDGIIIYFEDGSHTYIDPGVTDWIINEIYEVKDNEILIKVPYKEE